MNVIVLWDAAQAQCDGHGRQQIVDFVPDAAKIVPAVSRIQ